MAHRLIDIIVQFPCNIKIFNLPPSRIIGDLKERIKEAILEGEIRNDREEAFALLMKIAKEKGLQLAN